MHASGIIRTVVRCSMSSYCLRDCNSRCATTLADSRTAGRMCALASNAAFCCLSASYGCCIFFLLSERDVGVNVDRRVFVGSAQFEICDVVICIAGDQTTLDGC